MTTPRHQDLPGTPLSNEEAAALARAVSEGDEQAGSLLELAGFEDAARALGNLRRLAERLPAEGFAGLAPRLLPEITRSADPDMALNNVERVLRSSPEPEALAACWQAEPVALEAVTQLCACSQLLADILTEAAADFCCEIVQGGGLRRLTPEELSEAARQAMPATGGREARLNALKRFKRRALLRVASRDILQLATFGELAEEISDLATACVESALETCRQQLPPPSLPDDPAAPPDWWREFAVIAMGKLGGRELNYSSDVDLLFVYDAPWKTDEATPEPARRYFAALGTALIEALGSLTADGALFRVDLRLRPEGGAGSLVRSLAGYAAYYESWGEVWERQALIKASWVAGSRELAAAFLRLAADFVYGKRLDTEGVAEIKSVKARIEASARRAGRTDDVKVGPGCIRDIEFTVQLLQLIFGTHDERVRERSTLGALRALGAGKYLSPGERETLASAYIFLRTVEHQLQLMHGLGTRQLPQEEAALEKLARRLGLRALPGTSPAALLLSDYRRHTAAVRGLFAALFSEMFEGRDESDLRVRSLILSREDAGPAEEAVLGDYGVREPARGAAILRRLAHGTISAPLPATAAERFANLAPVVLQSAALTPDPDASLLHFEEFCGLIGSHGALYDLLARQPKTTGMLVRVAGCSTSLSAILARQPEYFDMLMDPGLMGRARSPEAMAEELEERLEGLADPALRLQAVLRFRRRELLRIGVRDLMDDADTETTLLELTALAELCLAGVLDTAARKAAGVPARDLPFAIIGLGKLGGREMHYNSDLDVLFVWGTMPGGNHELFTLVASEVLGQSGAQGAGPPLILDARLRPEGQSGPLARSVESCGEYYARWAEPWERMALVRARPVAGDEGVGQAFGAVIEPFLFGRGLSAEELEQILHAKGRIERERADTTPGVVDLKLGPGGINDIEFGVQLLQLAHGHVNPTVRAPGTLAGLRALARAGCLSREGEAERLEAAYLFLRRVESRLQVMHDWDESTISAARGGFERPARLLLYEDAPEATGAARFEADLRRHQAAAREIFESTVEWLRASRS